ncbi:ataxin-10 [Tripterygium wilfordii]|uniref:Ataxin-10 n=1 Tax=Tripterygium wilfordii TaxID=458696 RepID=A0A7J7DQN7_TRIWF|nr:ataxin-10 [Tripterygium wilfordii]KAF5748416.1 ataxin-10 [Tripterygium wilfordii]
MEAVSSMELSLSEDILRPLFNASSSTELEQALEILIESSRSASGRSELALKDVLPIVLRLCQSLPYPSGRQYLILSLKLLRNLCAGERLNQNSFIEQNGAVIVSNVLRSVEKASDPNSNSGILRTGVQVLANVSLAGEEHQRVIWDRLFPEKLLLLGTVRSREVCDPFCMVLYACIDGNPKLVVELCGETGLPIVAEVLRTASAVGFGEDWLKLLLSRICLESVHLPLLFKMLYGVEGTESPFSSEQAFLLKIVSEILSERIREISVPHDSALFVLEIFKKAVGVVDSVQRVKSGLPTGSSLIDVLGYSLTILRDICAQDGVVDHGPIPMDLVDKLVSNGLLTLLLCLLRVLEPPAMIRKAMKQSELQEPISSRSSKQCVYIGFRRDIVAVIGNCAYGRKHVQDEIRERNALLLMLQQCVADDENPFLREWGIWSVRNLLEGNDENQRVVAELEVQGTVDVPELTEIGLRVEVDHKTHRAKLVNLS